MSTWLEDLSKVADGEPEMLSKYSAFAGKLYKVKGSSVWMSTEQAAREAYLCQQAAGTELPGIRTVV